MILCYQVTQLLHIILPCLAEGFSDQRGAIFGFGPNAEEDTGTILKIEEISQAKTSLRKGVRGKKRRLHKRRDIYKGQAIFGSSFP